MKFSIKSISLALLAVIPILLHPAQAEEEKAGTEKTINNTEAKAGEPMADESKSIVKSIRVRYVGAPGVPREQILAKMITKAGEPLSGNRVDSDIRELVATGTVERVRVLSDEVEGGVDLIVVVECSPRQRTQSLPQKDRSTGDYDSWEEVGVTGESAADTIIREMKDQEAAHRKKMEEAKRRYEERAAFEAQIREIMRDEDPAIEAAAPGKKGPEQEKEPHNAAATSESPEPSGESTGTGKLGLRPDKSGSSAGSSATRKGTIEEEATAHRKKMEEARFEARIRAVVNGEPITQLEVDEAVRTRIQVYLMNNKGVVPAAGAERDIREMEEIALNDLIGRKLILSEFKTMGGSIQDKDIDSAVDNFVKNRFHGDRDKFIRALDKQGISLDQFREVQRDQIAINTLRSKHSGTGASMPSLPHEREETYHEIKGEYASEGKVKLHMLSIPKISSASSAEKQEELIKSIHSRILKGARFDAMAKEYSRDNFASKGGYVGVIGRGKLNERLTNIAYSLPAGKLSDVIDDGPSWRLIYVEGRVGQNIPSQRELAGEVEKRLVEKKRQQNIESWLKKLRHDAKLRIYD